MMAHWNSNSRICQLVALGNEVFVVEFLPDRSEHCRNLSGRGATCRILYLRLFAYRWDLQFGAAKHASGA
jgi:hypothetical protein